MPELPEVEIHARNLRAWLVGRRIERVEVLDPKLLDDPGPLPLETAAGQRVEAVRRDAKYLFLDLEGGVTLVAHLRMTGRFVRDAYVAGPYPKFSRLALYLDSGEVVRFEDRRRFGRAWLVPAGEERSLPELRELGPDALLQPISVERLTEAAGKTRRPIKVLLMDQTLLGGLGNICVIEVLYRARIAPERPANSLTPEELRRLAEGIPLFLEWAIEAQSRRELIYLGEKGAENVFTIYRREGTPCPTCGGAIVYTTLGGRGTYACPSCQS
ncbi:MAG: bifunctional DNA-formamidopyrimidine glycosylase/DNA-(apurinic or apyrimidinic site) lyase [Armatimonadota bacterium]